MSLLSKNDTVRIAFCTINAQADVIARTIVGIGAEVLLDEGHPLIPVHLRPAYGDRHFNFTRKISESTENIQYGINESPIGFVASNFYDPHEDVPWRIPSTSSLSLFPEYTMNLVFYFPRAVENKLFMGFYTLPSSYSRIDLKGPDEYTVDTKFDADQDDPKINIGSSYFRNRLLALPDTVYARDEGPNDNGGRKFTIFVAAKYADALVVTFDVWPAYFSGTANRSTSMDRYIRQGDEIGYFPSLNKIDGKPDGYTFAGWELKNGAIATSGYIPTENVTIRARWVRTVEIDDPDAPTPQLVRTLTFNANGGTVDSQSKQIRTGEPYGELPVPERRWFDFIGWYTSPYGDAEEVDTETVMGNRDVTVYAHWKVSEKQDKEETEQDESEKEAERMVKILMKQLPHKVGTASIKSAELKTIAMQFMENFKALHAQVVETQKAIIELQKKGRIGYGTDTSL